MASIIRSAKSGSDWSFNELAAYNITIRNYSAKDFFGRDLPANLENIDPEFLNTTNIASEIANDDMNSLLTSLDLATKANLDQESSIDDFAIKLLHTLGFEDRRVSLRSRYAIPLSICGDPERKAQCDVCLVYRTPTILLIIQEDKTMLSSKDPEPQVIAEAIAAFQNNNSKRHERGQEAKQNMSIPCITMVGTRPIFYIVPVTMQLSMAVERGEFPLHVTQVKKCVVGNTRCRRRRMSEGQTQGMHQPDFRVEAIKHYVLFRDLAKSLWLDFLAD